MKGLWEKFRSWPTWVQVVIVVVIAAAVAGGLAGEEDTEDRPAATPELGDGTAFDSDQVRVELELQAPFSRVEVHFIHEDGDVLRAAEECVAYYLESYDSVFCYGFATQEDFEDARVDTDSGGMSRLCWTARADKANPDADQTSQGGGPLDPGCPGA